jgi:hypothetical protein
MMARALVSRPGADVDVHDVGDVAAALDVAVGDQPGLGQRDAVFGQGRLARCGED